MAGSQESKFKGENVHYDPKLEDVRLKAETLGKGVNLFLRYLRPNTKEIK